MKLLLTFILLSLGYLVGKAPEPVKITEDFTYEISINSSGVDSAKFNLSITGFTLTETGARTPFQLEKKDLKTPYKLILKDGNYTAIVDSKSEDAVIISKVQGIKNGNRVGSASGNTKKTILDFGFGGNYSVTEK
ncbi:hypothetical protein I2I11_08500 [Pontibacter sp. 172403-2]|uniref:hypothetical protein n=1 Tax=Pontibacter rufus TaxID=2791028 RepID=UPI0018AFEA6F|nr:hypothetical protein [Pontibacter sp. 172403-2]MBF9253329.1 hypothetical protein [Pontibacter sp. 172403-2]